LPRRKDKSHDIEVYAVVIMGKVKKGEACSVKGCSSTAVRSLSPSYAGTMAKAGMEVDEGGRLYLCEEHYKKFKKANAGQEKLERWRLSG